MAHYSKLIVAASRDGIATGTDVTDLAAMGEATEEMNQIVLSRAQLQGLIKNLKPGQRYTVTVDTDVRPAERRDYKVGDYQHWVTIQSVSMKGGGSSGIVLYDPYPRQGKQYVFYDTPEFWNYFEQKDQGGVFKGCWIAHKSGADVTPKRAADPPKQAPGQ